MKHYYEYICTCKYIGLSDVLNSNNKIYYISMRNCIILINYFCPPSPHFIQDD